MSVRRFDLIEALVAELAPVRPIDHWARAFSVWFVLTGFVVAVAVFTIGAPRPGLRAEFANSIRLGVETALAVLCYVLAAIAALELGVPGSPILRKTWRVPLILFAAWPMLVLAELLLTTGLAASSAMRPHCFLETLSVSLPPALIGLILIRDRFVFNAARSGCFVGLAAAALPALWMQLSCMPAAPFHALAFHLSPMAFVAGGAALCTHFFAARA